MSRIDIDEVGAEPARLAVLGEIDVHTAPKLEQELRAHREELRLDLTGVTFIDSKGIKVLIDAKRSNVPGLLIEASRQVRTVFEITGLLEHLTASGSHAMAGVGIADGERAPDGPASDRLEPGGFSEHRA